MGVTPTSYGNSYSADGSTLTLTGTTFSITNGGVDTTQLSDDAVESAKIGTDQVGVDALDQDAEYVAPQYNILLWIDPTTVSGTWTWQTNSNIAVGEVYNTSNNDGDEVKWSRYLSAGTYTLITSHTGDSNCGIADIYVDGSEVGSVDTYSAGSTYGIINTITGITVSTAGIKDINIKGDGKNGSSSGHYIKFNTITLIRTA